MRPRAGSFFVAVAALLLTATTGPAADPDLTGRWSGHWQSNKSNHRGPLRGSFKQIDETHYRVVFTGRFFKVIPFRYAQTLEVTGCQGDQVLLAGSSRLGPVFGTFEYSAVASRCQFVATFYSKRDHGVFVLSR
jgi:hypothetical protein